MEISGKVLREVEFRDRLRGYDTDEVDEFLEKVALGVDALTARLEELEARLAAQPRPQEPAPAPAPSVDDDTLRRTLVLAQRTADLAVSEAREEASRLLEEARGEADGVVARAEDAARRMRSEAEHELASRVARLGEDRDRLEREVRSLARMVEDERTRLTESLTSALRFVRESLTVGDEAASRASEQPPEGPRLAPEPGSERPGSERPGSGRSEWPEGAEPAADAAFQDPAQPPATVERVAPSDTVQPELPDIEAELDEDAATAAWAPRAEPGRGHVGPARPIGTVPERSGEGEAEEALWERWAAGRDLGVVPGPSDFGRRPSSTRAERDQGWPA